MASEWSRLSLRDAGISLIDCDHRTPTAVPDGYPYITIPQLKDGHIEVAEARRITREDYEDWTKKLKPREHDVIVVRRCSSGVSAVVPKGLNCAIGQNLVVLRSDGRLLLPEFLRWLVRGEEWWEQVRKFLNVGAVFDSLKCKDIPNFEVTIPPLADQRAISGILGGLDDKISLLRETNVTLEAIAQALFKSWFVDFDPVRAKAEGREPEGVPPEVEDQFPCEFVDSELGNIPRGWRDCRLDEACEINPTRRISKGAEAPYLEMSALPTQGHRPKEPIPRAFSSGTKFIDGDSLLARITPCLENGKSAFVDFLGEQVVGWGSTEYIVLRPKAPMPAYWGYLLCRNEPFRQFATQAMAGTSGRQRVDSSMLAQYRVAIPSPGIAAAFSKMVEPIQRRIASNDDQVKALASLRDTLLPRLMSGKLRIPDVEEVTA